MAGPLRGKIDCYTNTGVAQTNVQSIFKGLYDFFLSHPNMTLIARNGGTSGTAASTGYWDEASPFLDKAWYVFRMNDAFLESGAANPYAYSGARSFPWYILVQYGSGALNSWSTGVAAPTLIDGVGPNTSAYIINVAFAIPVGTTPGTSEVAWNGGGTLGTNTKGTPVWRSTAGTPAGFQGCYVFPRSNNVGGSQNTNKENTSAFVSSNATTPIRYHIVADDDSFLIAINGGDDADQYNVCGFTMYNPRPGMTVNYPMVQVQLTTVFNLYSNVTFDNMSVYGNTSGTTGGGLPWNSLTDGVRGYTYDGYDEIMTTAATPNNLFTTEKVDMWNYSVLSWENPTYYAYVGDISFFKYAFSLGTMDLDNTKSFICLGSYAPGYKKVMFPWLSTQTPRTNFTRNGITF